MGHVSEEKLHNERSSVQRLLIIASQLISVVLYSLLLVYHYVKIGQLSNGVAIICLAMDLLLLFFFNAFSEPQLWLWVLMYFWISMTSLYWGSDIVSAFGGWVTRKWIICGLLFLTAVLLTKKERSRFLKWILQITLITVSVCCFLSEWSAAAPLLGKTAPDFFVQASLINGRLSAFGGANGMGGIASVGCVCAILLLMQLPSKRGVRIICGTALCLLFLIDFIALGWSRSRGTFVSFSLAMGAGAFAAVWLYGPKKKLLNFICSFCALSVF